MLRTHTVCDTNALPKNVTRANLNHHQVVALRPKPVANGSDETILSPFTLVPNSSQRYRIFCIGLRQHAGVGYTKSCTMQQQVVIKRACERFQNPHGVTHSKLKLDYILWSINGTEYFLQCVKLDNNNILRSVNSKEHLLQCVKPDHILRSINGTEYFFAMHGRVVT